MSEKFFNRSIDEWTVLVNQQLAPKYGKKARPIIRGTYRYDMFGRIIGEILKLVEPRDVMAAMRGQLDFNMFLQASHGGWIACFLEWNNNRRTELTIDIETAYRKACTYPNNLDQDDKNMYLYIIQIVIEAVAQQVLEAGMSSLSV